MTMLAIKFNYIIGVKYAFSSPAGLSSESACVNVRAKTEPP